MNTTYFRYLMHTYDVYADPTCNYDVDEISKQLLDFLAFKEHQGDPLTVSKAMGLKFIASPATIHRKLDELREAGLIEQIFEGKNRRTKFLVLAFPQTCRHFS